MLMQGRVVIYKETNKESIAQMVELVAQSLVVTAHAVRCRVVAKPLSKVVCNRDSLSRSDGLTHRPILERKHGKWIAISIEILYSSPIAGCLHLRPIRPMMVSCELLKGLSDTYDTP